MNPIKVTDLSVLHVTSYYVISLTRIKGVETRINTNMCVKVIFPVLRRSSRHSIMVLPRPHDPDESVTLRLTHKVTLPNRISDDSSVT